MRLAWLGKYTSQSRVWPAIDTELREHRPLLRGKVLNAGAGTRDVSHLVDGDLVTQDICLSADGRRAIDIHAPLDRIPVEDDHFDAIICIAVLEHVEDPAGVMAEFHRVLKPGGHVIASVPFLQPEHKVPTDFQRYTRDGLVRLVTHHGFEVVSVKALFTVYHTLHWIAWEWLHLRDTLGYRLLRLVVMPALAIAARRATVSSDRLASAFQVVARKPREGPRDR
jgi:SAM-dependent methyltransferase